MRKAIITILLLLAFLIPAPAPAALLLNLSTRVEIPPPFLGQDITSVIGGFIIGGTKSRKVLIRAIGPSLADFGLVPLPDPTLVLYDATGTVLASNDNWMDTQETEIRDTLLQPGDPLESAIVMTLTPGTYTAIVKGHDPVPGNPMPGSGTALVELYDLSPIIAQALVNISTRGAVQGTANPMIAGFILGNGDNVTILLRALGPSLNPFGLSGLSDPRLDLLDGEGNLLASNDNWQDTQSGDIAATGLAPADAAEAAILINLPRGTYTAVLSPVDSQAHGTALAELYKLE
ncbi:MAG: hypothetical protein ABIU29_07155 [Chthoniobacterales bacterium]